MKIIVLHIIMCMFLISCAGLKQQNSPVFYSGLNNPSEAKQIIDSAIKKEIDNKEIDKRLKNQENRSEAYQASINSLVGLNGKVTGIEKVQTELQSEINGVKEANFQLKTKISGIEGDISAIKLNGDISAIKSQIDTKFITHGKLLEITSSSLQNDIALIKKNIQDISAGRDSYVYNTPPYIIWAGVIMVCVIFAICAIVLTNSLKNRQDMKLLKKSLPPPVFVPKVIRKD